MTGINYMLAHHIVVQYELIEHCVCTYWNCLFCTSYSSLVLSVLICTFLYLFRLQTRIAFMTTESPDCMSSLGNYPRSPTAYNNKKKLVKDFNLVPTLPVGNLGL